MTDKIEEQGHKRGCEGRNYACTCGYDDRVEAELSRLRSALENAPDRRHFEILAEAMAEVKATSDGLSYQPIADIVAGCLEEIDALSLQEEEAR